MSTLEQRTLLTSKLAQVRLPSASSNDPTGRGRPEVFYVHPSIAGSLVSAHKMLSDINPRCFALERTFFTHSQQYDLFLARRQNSTDVRTAPPGWSARECGRAVDLKPSLTPYFDGEYDYRAATLADFQDILGQFGFVNVVDGVGEPRDVWELDNGELHLEWWADLTSSLTQSFRDAHIRGLIEELYG